jgi:hypothetical protein
LLVILAALERNGIVVAGLRTANVVEWRAVSVELPGIANRLHCPRQLMIAIIIGQQSQKRASAVELKVAAMRFETLIVSQRVILL